MEKRTNASAIKEFFQADGGRKVTMEEFKRLSNDEREELGQLAAKALDVISVTNGKAAAESDERPALNESRPVSQDALHVE